MAELLLSALPRDGRPWEVVAYGKVRAANEVDEASCELFLAEAGWEKEQAGEEPQQVLQSSVEIGLGQLPHVPIGSFWQDGRRIEQPRRPERRIEIASASARTLRKLGQTVAHQNADRPAIPAYPVPADALPLFRVKPAQGNEVFWVPAFELARATFGLTSEWLRLMAEGGLRVHPQPLRRIIELDRSYRPADDPRALHLHAWRRLANIDVLIASRICGDEQLRQSFEDVANHLRAHRYGSGGADVVMRFPFARPSTWEIEDRWIAVKKDDGEVGPLRLITRIRSIEYDLAVDRVRVFYPKTRAEVGESTLGDEATVGSWSRARVTLDDVVDVVSGLASSSVLGSVNYETGEEHGLNGLSIEHVPVDVEQHAASAPPSHSAASKAETATTADAGNESERAGLVVPKANIRGTTLLVSDTPRRPSARIEATLSAFRWLAAEQQRDFEVIKPPAGPGAEDLDGLWRYPSSDGGRPLPWAITGDGLPRRALVVRMAGNSGIYAFEAEYLEAEAEAPLIVDGAAFRLPKDRQTALGLLKLGDHKALPTSAIPSFLILQASCRGVWKNAPTMKPIVRIPRAAAWLQNPAAYAFAIARGIRRLDGPEAES